jgi:hypothetical protein
LECQVCVILVALTVLVVEVCFILGVLSFSCLQVGCIAVMFYVLVFVFDGGILWDQMEVVIR